MALRVFRQSRSGEEVIQLTIRLGLLAALIYWCFVIVSPFIPILAWAVVLAVALYPLYVRLADHLVVSRSQHIPRIQEAHATASHLLRELVEVATGP